MQASGKHNQLPVVRDDRDMHDPAAAGKEAWIGEGYSWTTDGWVEAATATTVGCATTTGNGELKEG